MFIDYYFFFEILYKVMCSDEHRFSDLAIDIGSLLAARNTLGSLTMKIRAALKKRVIFMSLC